MYEFETIEKTSGREFTDTLKKRSRQGWEIVSSGLNDYNTGGSYGLLQNNWWAVLRKPLEIGDI